MLGKRLVSQGRQNKNTYNAGGRQKEIDFELVRGKYGKCYGEMKRRSTNEIAMSLEAN